MTFEELHARISPKLRGIVYKISSYVTCFDRDDLYGEAIANLWMDFKKGKLTAKTDSYVLQSCYFYLKNYVRKYQDKVDFVSMDLLFNGVGLQQHELAAGDEKEEPAGQDMDALMEEVFNTGLTRKEREVTFFYLQGWTTREIGQRLGISHVRVVKIQSKIREKCKEFRDLS